MGGYIFAADSLCVVLQISEQFSPEKKNANPLDAKLKPDFNAKWPFKVIQGHPFRRQSKATTGYIVYSMIIVTLNMKVRKI